MIKKTKSETIFDKKYKIIKVKISYIFKNLIIKKVYRFKIIIKILKYIKIKK